MLTLITGTPGAGKTALALSKAVAMATDENRVLWLYGIRNPALEVIPCDARILESPELWHELPEGSIVLIDEAQQVFRQRKMGDLVPAHVQALETHRHRAFDLFLTTQAPGIIDHAVKRLAGRHFHVQALPGGSRATVFEYLETQAKPTDYHTKMQALSKSAWKRPAEVFKWYESTVEVTGGHKFAIPKKIFLMGAFVMAILGLIVWRALSGELFSSFRGDSAAHGVAESDHPAGHSIPTMDTGGLSFQSGSDSFDPEKLPFADLWQPEVKGLPHSAPGYRDVFKAADFPVPRCVIVTDYETKQFERCFCLSQQGTSLAIPEPTCIGFAESGFYDPSIARNIHSQRRREGSGGGG